MLDTPLPPGLKLIRVVPAAQRLIAHPPVLATSLLPTPQTHTDTETRHYDIMGLSSAQQRLDTLVQRRSFDDSMIFSSIAGGGFSEGSRPNTYEYAPPFPKPPATLLSSPAFSSLKVDLSSFDHKSDPYYLEKRKQILKKFDQESKSASAHNPETSFDAKIRSINEQLLELERTPKLVEEALLAADEPVLKFSLTAELKEPPISSKPLLPVKPQLKDVSPKRVSTKEDPYDKYNKNPIGNIIGKRALRIKQQLAQKKAEEEIKTSGGASLEDDSALSEKLETTDNENSQASECVENVHTTTPNLTESNNGNSNSGKDSDVVEVSSSIQSGFELSLAAESNCESSLTPGTADSSTDKPEVISRSTSQSWSLGNDVVDSTTSPDEIPEVNHIVCQSESQIDVSVQQQSSAIESRIAELGSEDTNDDSEIEVIRELPPEVNDDQILASFLREQREAVGRKPQETASSSQHPWERSTSPVRVTSTKPDEPRKISALRRFHADDSSISDRKRLFHCLGIPNTSKEPAIELHGLSDRNYTPIFNVYSSRNIDDNNVDYDDVDDGGDQTEKLQKRLLREAIQAEEERRNREMAIHPPRRITTPPSYSESLESWRNFPTRSSSSDYIDEELRNLEKQRDMLAAQIEKQRQLNEEKKRQKILEFKKREEVRKRLREEFEKKREQDRQVLLAERKKLILLKQKEEEERRRKLEEERREAERREQERKERERMEKLRREKAEKELNTWITEVIRRDSKNEYVSSMKNDGTGITKVKCNSIPEAVCICFENFEPSFDRINALMKKKCFTKIPLNEDYIVAELASNFDDELIIPYIDVAIQSVKEFRVQRKIENFIKILQRLPDNYPQEPDETEYILDQDLPYYKDSDESSDEEVKSMAKKIREECQKSREAQKIAREKARKAAEEAAKLEAEQKAKREAARAERERLQMERNRIMKERAMESLVAERSREMASLSQDMAPLSISTVVRRDPDDPGRINYEPEKRKTSSMLQIGRQHSCPRSLDKKCSSSHYRGPAGMGPNTPVKIKQDALEPSLGIPIPPPSLFPPVIAPDASVVYNAAAASFAATYFPNYKFVSDFMDDKGARDEGVAHCHDRRQKNRTNRSPLDRHKTCQKTESFSNSNFSPFAVSNHRSRVANRSRSRSFSSSDFKPPSSRKRPKSQSSTDSFSSTDSRSTSPTHRSTTRKRKKMKMKKRHESSKKLKRKSRKHGREKRKSRHGDEKLRKRKKLKKRKKMLTSDQPNMEDNSESLMSNDKIFINPHHQNFKAIQKKYSSSNVISSDMPDVGIIKQEPLSSESSYDSFSD